MSDSALMRSRAQVDTRDSRNRTSSDMTSAQRSPIYRLPLVNLNGLAGT